MSGLSTNLTDNDRRFTFSSAALPASTFDVVSLTGTEAISKNFSFELILVCDLETVSFDDMLSNPATLTLFAPGAKSPTPYYGVLSEFEQLQAAGKYVFYRAVLQPRLQAFDLYRTSDVFIDGKKIPDVITEVLTRDKRMADGVDFQLKLKNNYSERDFICQYQETDLEFLQRWMEREGIYSYFDHSGKIEKLVLVDATIGLPADKPKALAYRPTETVQTDDGNNSLQSMVCKQKPLPKEVTLRGFNCNQASAVMEKTAEVSSKGKGRVMLYGESFLDDRECTRYAGIRAEEIACQGKVFEGRASAVGLRSGYFFVMLGHYRNDWNGVTCLVTEIAHEGSQAGALLRGLSTPFGRNSGETSYSANFKAIPQATQFRPERSTIKPYIAGSLTAVIDGDAKAIYADVDKTGRYRVMFPFCKAGKDPSKRSARIRMATPYSGRDYGMNFPLHVGAEVMVSFLDGDPDQPVIVNAVPNSENTNVTNDTNYMLGMVKTAAGNALTFDDTHDAESSTVYSPLGFSRWRVGQKAAGQNGVVPSKQLTWGDARPGLHGKTEEDISLSAGHALVLAAGIGAGVAKPQLRPDLGHFQLSAKYGLINMGEQTVTTTVTPPAGGPSAAGVDGTLDIYAKHINMYAEPTGDASAGTLKYGYILQSGAPTAVKEPLWDMPTLYSLQSFTDDAGQAIKKTKAGVNSVVSGNKTTYTQGDSNSATYGNSASVVHGNSIKLTRGADMSHTYGASESTYFGATASTFMGSKADLSMGANNSLYIGQKGDVFIGEKQSVAISREIKLALSFVADLSFGLKVGIDGTVNCVIKTVYAEAAATVMKNHGILLGAKGLTSTAAGAKADSGGVSADGTGFKIL
jgi:type VI secretion system VgrG family protein